MISVIDQPKLTVMRTCYQDCRCRIPNRMRKKRKKDYVQSVDIENTCLTARMNRIIHQKGPYIGESVTLREERMAGTKKLILNEEIIAYWNRRSELSVELGCITWGCRVIIPTKLRSTVLDMLHRYTSRDERYEKR